MLSCSQLRFVCSVRFCQWSEALDPRAILMPKRDRDTEEAWVETVDPCSSSSAQKSPECHPRVVFSFVLNDVSVDVAPCSVIQQPAGGLTKLSVDAVPLWACFYPSVDAGGAQLADSTKQFRHLELAVWRAFPVTLCSGVRLVMVDVKNADKPTVLLPHPVKRTVTLTNGGQYCIGTFVRGELVVLPRASKAERGHGFGREQAEVFATRCTHTDTETNVILRRGLRRFLENLRLVVPRVDEDAETGSGHGVGGWSTVSADSSAAVRERRGFTAPDGGQVHAWCRAQRTLAAWVGGLLLHGVEMHEWRDGPTACAALATGLASFHSLPNEEQQRDLCRRGLLRARIRLAK